MRNRVARPTVLFGAVWLALVLCGCTTPAEPAGPHGAPSAPPEKTRSVTPSPTETIEPIVVVAAVDIDGRHVTASGYVQGIIEDGGACSFTFTHDGSEPVTVEHPAAADRGSTACGAVQPEIERFVRGTWAVTLTYTSPTGEFHSKPQTLEVP